MSHWRRDGDAWVADAPDAIAMRSLGRQLATSLRAGDLLILDGPLGAGKTTFTQGIAEGLGVRGPITSPTFVIARRHPPADRTDGPALVHVDAYRLADAGQVEDLDLEADSVDAVTVVEWGVGKAEGLAQDRLVISIDRALGLAGRRPAERTADDPGQAEPAAHPHATAEPLFRARAVAGPEEGSEVRVVHVTGVGARWADLDLPGTG